MTTIDAEDVPHREAAERRQDRLADAAGAHDPDLRPVGRADAPSLTVLNDGEEFHEVGGRAFRLRPGQMLLVLDAGAEHVVSTRADRPSRGFRVSLPTGLLLPEWSDALGPALVRTVAGAEEARLAALLDPTVGVDEADLPASIALCCVGIVRAALARLARLDVRRPRTAQAILQRLEAARAHLHGSLDRQVSLDELATEAGMSGFHLARYFAQVFGEPPARYHRSLRLAAAAAELRADEVAVGEIAFRFGYAELSAFTHAFRREFGKPPMAVRRSTAQCVALAA